MHRRDEPEIGLQGLVAADAFELPLLQYTQHLRLEGRRDVTNLVKEKRAAIGDFEAPLPLVDRTGKGPFFMAE